MLSAHAKLPGGKGSSKKNRKRRLRDPSNVKVAKKAKRKKSKESLDDKRIPSMVDVDDIGMANASACAKESIYKAAQDGVKGRMRVHCEHILQSIRKRSESKDIKCSAPEVSETSELLGLNSFFNAMIKSDNHLQMSTVQAFNAQAGMGTDTEGVTRAWEECYMREPIQSEPACMYSLTNKCIATEMFKDEHGPDFTLMRFYTPSEYAVYETEPHRIVEPGPCIMCLRNDVLNTVLQTRANGDNVLCTVSVSNIYNFVDVPGEYMSQHCICSLPNRYEGLIDPVVMPLKCYFSAHKTGGVRHLCQMLPRPEDVDVDF